MILVERHELTSFANFLLHNFQILKNKGCCEFIIFEFSDIRLSKRGFSSETPNCLKERSDETISLLLRTRPPSPPVSTFVK